MYHAQRYLITSALPYANGPLHIGHLSGAYLSADVYVRFLRLMGKEVLFVCGSDEHGAAITLRAQKESKTPKEIVDLYHEQFQEDFQGMNISFDIYHRTSSQLHHETSQEFFRTLLEKGALIKKDSRQFYDPEAEQFLADRYIKGTCPKCGHTEAYGDQCENCGSSLSPEELIDPVSTLTGKKPQWRDTSHWYLPLGDHEEFLQKYIVDGTWEGKEHHDPHQWKNHVLGQCRSWIEGGLEARAMTRDLDWGVDVPQEVEGSEGKKLYVWLDAPIGYISATKEWATQNNKDWKSYWQDPDSCLIHFIGKDNIVFHCLIFPVILKSHGDYILPYNVPANQFMNLEGQKISTSRDWAIWVRDYLERWKGREDELRYYLVKNMPEQKDSDFSWKGFQEAVNADLVNNLGNFINRVLVLTHKYYDGQVPAIDEDLEFTSPRDADEYSFHDSELLYLFDLLHEYGDHIRSYKLREALKVAIQISSLGNQLLQFNAPWKLIKEDEETTKVVMNLAIQYVAALSAILSPFVPAASDRLREMLGLEGVGLSDSLLQLMNSLAEGEQLLPEGHQINPASHLFTRIEDAQIEAELEKLQSKLEPMSSAAPIKDNVEFGDFGKLDLRVGTLLSAKKVPKTSKLLEFQVDLGFEKRTVVSGVAEYYDPETLPGRKVVVVANLAPKKIRGVESKGMILLGENADGSLHFVVPSEESENGSVVS